jgi:hypothetical protein
MAEEPRGEYTRLRADIQLGDGIDRRGEVTIEVVRAIDTESEKRRTRSVVLPDESTLQTETSDEVFAEFYFECGRATRALQERLGLRHAGDDAEDGDE